MVSRKVLGPGIWLCLLLFACGEEKKLAAPTPPPGPVAVTVALNWYPEPEFGGMYMAREKGLYKDAGLDVTIQTGGPGAPVTTEVATAKVQFGVVTGDEVVLGRAAGADLRAIFATFQIHPQAIMVHQSRGLKDLGELKSGTLALESGPPFATWLIKKFGFEGVTRVPYDGNLTRFVSEKDYAIQCYETFEPHLAKSQGADVMLFRVADTGYNPYANVVITSDALIQTSPQVVQKFVTATRKGWELYLSDPAVANEAIIQANPTLARDLLDYAANAQKALIQTEDTTKGGLGIMSEERWGILTNQLKELGIVTGSVSPADVYTNRFLSSPPTPQ